MKLKKMKKILWWIILVHNPSNEIYIKLQVPIISLTTYELRVFSRNPSARLGQNIVSQWQLPHRANDQKRLQISTGWAPTNRKWSYTL